MLNSQRDRIYSERRKALLSDSLESVMVEYSEETMNDILEVRRRLPALRRHYKLEGEYCGRSKGGGFL